MSAREGVALRTLVYHEVLQGYLTYVKARGYTSMFIWACPPLQVLQPLIPFHPDRSGDADRCPIFISVSQLPATYLDCNSSCTVHVAALQGCGSLLLRVWPPELCCLQTCKADGPFLPWLVDPGARLRERSDVLLMSGY